jgi:hypothetical protein
MGFMPIFVADFAHYVCIAINAEHVAFRAGFTKR